MAGKPESPCGTESAFQRHKRRSEAPCSRCVTAHSEYLASRRSEYADLADGDTFVDPSVPAVDSVSRLKDLEFSRDRLQAAIDDLSKRAPEKIGGLVKELRETWREIDLLTGDAEVKEDPFDAFFRNDNVVGFPAPKSREVS